MFDDLLSKVEPAILALADGTVFYGKSIGVSGETQGEVVFNTAMTGYQEILTDPSYAEQIITFTYPHIGNIGVNPDDFESNRVWASGLIIRELSLNASNWRATHTLSDFLKKQNVVAIAHIDTRRLTRILREKGAQSGCIITGKSHPDVAIQKARTFSGLSGKNLTSIVSAQQIFKILAIGTKGAASGSQATHIIAFDFGVKKNILKLFAERGCDITVVPANTNCETILKLKPDGIFLSNGPGDPAACHEIIQTTRELLKQKIPLFGICLGFQLIALACGAKTMKMKLGHHGANHPIQDLISKKVFITSQNHGFCVDKKTLPNNLIATHVSLFDGTLQGFKHKTLPVFAFQGHPEASPGPQEMIYLFDDFVSSLSRKQCAARE